ncbi:MAG: Maf family protein [Terriglobia bacterium]
MPTTPHDNACRGKLILASSSPRRREILQAAGFEFEVVATSVREEQLPGESPETFVCRLATEKAAAALDRIAHPCAAPILGADTVVVLGNEMLGKPVSAEDAQRMLRMLSGREHRVLTGLCLLSPPPDWPSPLSELRKEVQFASTLVQFAELTEEEIEAYVASGEPFDKAGGYAIQGLASKYVEEIQGCYFNVVGLPVSLLYQMLQRLHSDTAMESAQKQR